MTKKKPQRNTLIKRLKYFLTKSATFKLSVSLLRLIHLGLWLWERFND